MSKDNCAALASPINGREPTPPADPDHAPRPCSVNRSATHLPVRSVSNWGPCDSPPFSCIQPHDVSFAMIGRSKRYSPRTWVSVVRQCAAQHYHFDVTSIDWKLRSGVAYSLEPDGLGCTFNSCLDPGPCYSRAARDASAWLLQQK